MKMTSTKQPDREIDYFLLLIALLLTTIGILLVFDASYVFANLRNESEFTFLIQQTKAAVLGLIFCAICAWVPYWKWRQFTPFLIGVTLILLLLVFVPRIGVEIGGAHRWIGFGHFQFQPSELAKLVLVLALASACAGRERKLQQFPNGVFNPFLIFTVVVILTVAEPDIGTTLVLVGAGVAVMGTAGVRKRHLAVLLASLLVVGIVFSGLRTFMSPSRHRAGFGYLEQRWQAFAHPSEDTSGIGYQVSQGKKGGLFGVGLGQGRGKMFLPESFSDMVFAIAAEEGGFVMSLVILLLICCLTMRGLHIACNTRDVFGCLVAAGFSAIIGIQALLHVCSVSGFMPSTGVPLPFLSSGGTSLIIILSGVGILLNIARFPDGDPQKQIDKDRESERQYDQRTNKGTVRSGELVFRPGHTLATASPQRLKSHGEFQRD
jgi:cell division protein FtsW